MTPTLKQLYDRCEPVGECQIWKQATINGHPQAYINGKGGQMVRRYIFTELLGKRLRKGELVSPRCGNSLCIAVGCIRAITYSERLKKAYLDGSRDSPTTYLSLVQRRIANGQTTLSFEKAREIRGRTESNVALSHEYGVHPKTIARARKGLSWRETLPGASVFSVRP